MDQDNGRARVLAEDVVVRQTIEIEPDSVRRLIEEAYRSHGTAASADQIQLKVHGSSGSGYSRSGPGFRGAVIRLRGDDAEQAESRGLPTSYDLTEAACSAILAARLTRLVGREVSPERISWDVLDASGHGFHASGPRLRAAVLRLQSVI